MDVQKSIEGELKKSSSKKGKGGCYAKMKPVHDVNGLWIVGEWVIRYNAMTLDSSLQKLLPTQHPATRLFMQRAHQAGHRGQGETLAQFRMHYWAPHGSKLAKTVKMNRQLYK